MNRKELIAAVHAGIDGLVHAGAANAAVDTMIKAAANAAVDTMIKTIKRALAAGDAVEINGLGKFVPVERQAKVGRNFKTGEPVEIAARRGVRFRPSMDLRKLS